MDSFIKQDNSFHIVNNVKYEELYFLNFILQIICENLRNVKQHNFTNIVKQGENFAEFPAIIGRAFEFGVNGLFDVTPDPFFSLINLFY